MTEAMDVPEGLRRDGQRLIQVGAVLFLFGLLVGLTLQKFTAPRVALSTHLLGVMQGTFLMVAGLLWPRLAFTRSVSRVGSTLAIYGCLAAWTGNFLAAFWGAGGAMLPMASMGARGSAVQEGAIRILLMSAAACLVATAILLLWGLRSREGSTS